ncbi:putative DNA modification/repair radical SAM protein [Thalassobium sp. R2A62]|jgi:putative DNA modification/repair radical SAM protein|uniref:putative DNA modification/repair radical SAM protein n=1 Tax=Thalassobium sp. R2A62 TaxID=633131 RepID=UPI0001B1CCCE|nr:putative DNA modification/repair radical SAM protein [Thalassobium sp. R2A62]EET48455.1 radical SAM [Thalassobium sp. R2A62]
MVQRSVQEKLAILSDAAKYDASCASSGSTKRDSRDGKGLGSNEGSGICHAYAPDGRCISLLKILMTNFCIYDCAYCMNRVSSNVTRARFSVDEVVKLTIDFYRRNYIEGLFLSSGIIRSPDATMEDMVCIARKLRHEEHFRGYIHLKTIPDAAPELIEEAGLLADRLSINVELPTDAAVKSYAPEKKPEQIRAAMADVRLRKEVARDRTHTGRRAPKFAPAGQSTQMIVGADGSNDAAVLGQSTRLYSSYKLKRVYYSAFSPIPDASSKLPLVSPPLQREHRLYQADWLLRFYGFDLDEITGVTPDGNLDLGIDPKLAWALQHRGLFPMDVNRASREMLLRVPGFGVKTVQRILGTRRHRALRYEDLQRMGASLKKARAFITAVGWTPRNLTDSADLRARFAPPPEQLNLL